MSIDSLMPRRAQWLVTIGVAIVASCHHVQTYDGGPVSAKHGAYAFQAAIWSDGHPYHALCPLGRLCPDSVGLLEGTVTLAEPYEESAIDLDTTSDGPGCVNHGVRRIPLLDLRGTQGRTMLGTGAVRMKRGGDDMVTFLCPGLGREKDLAVGMYVSVHDPVGNAFWFMWFDRPECLFSPLTCQLILYGDMRVRPSGNAAE